MLAVISDIHANLEALEAVLADIRRSGVEEIICLGDVVGYGPDPVARLRRATTWPVVVAGDWDRAVVEHDPRKWSPQLNRYIESTRRAILNEPDGRALLEFMSSRELVHEDRDCLFCHAAPGDVREFVFPEDIYNRRGLRRIAKTFDRTMFVGHTHLAGAFASQEAGEWEYIEAASGATLELRSDTKVICNVGSLGQPRDGDPRASYVLFDGQEIQFRRVDYDLETTIAKIKDDPDIDDIQGGDCPKVGKREVRRCWQHRPR